MTLRAKKVVVVVFDGLRPDMVTAQNMPTLADFAHTGLWFKRSRTVFPSVTRVATTSFATGAPPAVHGIVGNMFHQPDAAPKTLIDTSNLADIARADAHFGGRLVTATSLGEALASAGRTMMVVHGGSPGASWFLNHRAAANGHWTFSIHGREATQTPHAVADAEAVVGPPPPLDLPRHAVVDHCARVMAEVVLPRAPDLAVMWLPEPDTSFHYREIGSQETRAVMGTADRAFAAVLDAVRASPDAGETMVIALSDHGQLTVSEKMDTAELFGIEDDIARGDVLLTGGRYGELRRPDGDRTRLVEMARRLIAEDKVGHVLARDDLAAQANLIPFSAVG
ncbi:MAG: alkaline phosphatase family protein, partial [Pseudomonadota bacterium]